ncbi:MAG: hypothetical protein DME55_08670 [Verrucomicrobia bacterium]|nr:MAG: hypothetical protein DME55_08670 [Verrucomicrobiota bacterium]
MHFIHCLLHAVLGPIQFKPHIFPITFVRRLDDRLGMWRDRISDANPLRQCHDTLANILYRRRVFRLHRDETISDHCPQQECNTRPLGEIWPFIAADVFLPIDRSELVQRPENFVRQWHHNVFHSRG